MELGDQGICNRNLVTELYQSEQGIPYKNGNLQPRTGSTNSTIEKEHPEGGNIYIRRL